MFRFYCFIISKYGEDAAGTFILSRNLHYFYNNLENDQLEVVFLVYLFKNPDNILSIWCGLMWQTGVRAEMYS